MANLIKIGALKGSCCLTKDQASFQYLKKVYRYVTEHENHAESHITPRIIKAVEGEFGGNTSKVEAKITGGVLREYHAFDPVFLKWFIQPLMNLYWFWDADSVIQNNKLITKEFCRTNTFTDVNIVHRAITSDEGFLKKYILQDNSILF